MTSTNTQSKIVARPPVVVVMGHVDHGKSTLLDYIRKTNVVDKEAGGITQHISAYEVSHKDEKGEQRLISFLDTPGHEAFSQMRARGASAADIAILVVSAEDSVKAQTMEAWQTIIDSNTPYIVAINKIDKPNANIEKTKMDLLEKGIYLEGLGGDIPWVAISAKAGTGISELLDIILLVADLNEFTTDYSTPATGVIIESHRDPKRGISATGIIKDGTLKTGMFVLASGALSTTRIMENFLGKPVKELKASSPFRITGFDEVPEVGSVFTSFVNKKDAETKQIEDKESANKGGSNFNQTAKKFIPIVIKADVSGTIEAIEKEISKINTDDIAFKIVGKGAGSIGEADLKTASIDKESVIVGFNVKIESSAKDSNENLGVSIKTFNIIYELTDFLKTLAEERRPRQETREIVGKFKVLKTFSKTKDKQVVGGRVIEGRIGEGNQIQVMRRESEIGFGKIIGIEQNKVKAKEVPEDTECGMLVESRVEISSGDILEAFKMVIK